MLTGINPLLNGDLLRVLDHMGHNDVILIADAQAIRYLPVTSFSYVLLLPLLRITSTPRAVSMTGSPGTAFRPHRLHQLQTTQIPTVGLTVQTIPRRLPRRSHRRHSPRL